MPGVKKEDLEVSVVRNRLSIKGVTSNEEKSENGELYRREIRRGEVSRSIALPAEVDATNAEASFANGVLTVTLPKLEQTKRRSIKVE
jgi:HSP20 family protein